MKDNLDPNKTYRNQEWLERQYVVLEKSQSQIGREINIAERTIGNWMDKFKIPRREHGQAVHLARGKHEIIDKEVLEIMQGCLLGDGSLIRISNYSALFKIGQSENHKSWVYFLKDFLEDHGISCSRVYEYVSKGSGFSKKGNKYFSMETSPSEYLLEEYKRWYPEQTKIVPYNIDLTPKVLLYWHLGDGSLSCQGPGSYKASLATYGFRKEDVQHLCDLFLSHNITAHRTGANGIAIPSGMTLAFFEFMDNCPGRLWLDFGYRFEVENIPEWRSPKYLRKRYIEDKMSTVEIANELGTYDTVIGRWLKKFNIPARGNSEAQRVKYLKTRSEQ